MKSAEDGLLEEEFRIIEPSHRSARSFTWPLHRYWTVALLIFIVVAESVALCLTAQGQFFWYDELLTVYTSSLHPFAMLWQALQTGVDSMPPAFYAFILLARNLSGKAELVLRLPSIAGYVLALLGVYWFAARRVQPAFAAIATLLLALSPFRDFALQARPYTLLVGFLAMAAVFWQRIEEKPWAWSLFACFLSLAAAVHHLAVMTVACFVAAELAVVYSSRRLRLGVWVGCFVAVIPFLFTLPVLLHFRQVFGTHFWARANPAMALTTFSEIFGLSVHIARVCILVLLTLLSSTLWATRCRVREEAQMDGFRPAETVLVCAFLLYPCALIALATIEGGGYADRYGWPAILGFALGSASLLQFNRTKPVVSYCLIGALLMAFLLRSAHDVRSAINDFNGRPTPAAGSSQLLRASRARPNVPVVIGEATKFLETLHYAAPDLKSRLVEIIDDAAILRFDGTDSAAINNQLLSQYRPLRIEDAQLFLRQNSRFLLHCWRSTSWLLPYLGENHYRLTLVEAGIDGNTYLAERESDTKPSDPAL